MARVISLLVLVWPCLGLLRCQEPSTSTAPWMVMRLPSSLSTAGALRATSSTCWETFTEWVWAWRATFWASWDAASARLARASAASSLRSSSATRAFSAFSSWIRASTCASPAARTSVGLQAISTNNPRHNPMLKT